MTFIKPREQFTSYCARFWLARTCPHNPIRVLRGDKSAKFVVLAFVLLASMCFSGKTLAQESLNPENAVKPFQTDLWQLEFHQEEKEQEAHRQNGDSPKKGGPPVPFQKSEANATSALITNPLISDEEELNQLRTETTFDELQIESSLANEQERGAFRHETTAWTLSQARGSMGSKAEELSKGPTLTTFLVGVVACIVMTGAIFSGRN